MNSYQAVWQIAKNVISNVIGSFAPEPFIDRRGRLRGNFYGLIDVVLRRQMPERASQMVRDLTKGR